MIVAPAQLKIISLVLYMFFDNLIQSHGYKFRSYCIVFTKVSIDLCLFYLLTFCFLLRKLKPYKVLMYKLYK